MNTEKASMPKRGQLAFFTLQSKPSKGNGHLESFDPGRLDSWMESGNSMGQ
jgi:hypothetical protein